MVSLLKIGEMSKLNHISIQALRYYEKKAVLLPVFIDEKTGYRYYSVEQSPKLDMIQFLQGSGFRLEEIKDILLNNKSEQNLNQLLENKKNEILNLEKKLLEQKELLNQYKDANIFYNQYKNNMGIEFIYLPQRYMLTYPINKNIYQMNLLEYEHQLRKFKMDLAEKKLPSHYFHRVGSLMSLDNLSSDQFISKELFIFTQPEMASQYSLKTIPAHLYAVIYCRHFEEEVSTIKKLIFSLKNKQCQMVGDYICEVIHEAPNFQNNKRNMFLRLQVPVMQNI